MKIAKRAQQKNFIINTDFYTSQQIKEMLQLKEIFFINTDFTISHSFDKWRKLDCPELRIYTADLTDIKVALIDGYYQTIAVGKNAITYYVVI